MGDVAIVYRVMPNGVDVNIEALMDSISKIVPDGATLEGMMVKDVAFGIKAVLMRVIIPDKVGGGIPDLIEEKVGSLEGVAGIEVLEQTLV